MTSVFTIQELSAEVGGDVTPRTIRYYIAEGLLPKPDERGQYTQNHLQRLQLIRRYREAFIPLEMIRSQLITLTDAQVAETLQETRSPTETTESAAAYTARLLAGYTGQQARSAAPPNPPPPAAPTGTVNAPGGPDLHNALSLHRLVNERSVAAKVSNAANAPETETWERISLAPGIELHRRVPLTPEADAYLRALLAHTQTLDKSR